MSKQQKPESIRVVFKWLSKVIAWLRLLRLVINLNDSRQFFNQWESKPKPIAPCTRDLSRASSELHVIARNCDWFLALSAPVVIGRSNCVVIWSCATIRSVVLKGPHSPKIHCASRSANLNFVWHETFKTSKTCYHSLFSLQSDPAHIF